MASKTITFPDSLFSHMIQRCDELDIELTKYIVRACKKETYGKEGEKK